MVQRFKNPNRSNQKIRKQYVPEYRRHGISPVPIDENGRVDEEKLSRPSVLGLGSVPKRHGPPLNVGFQDNVAFSIDGSDYSADEEYYENDIPFPNEESEESPQETQQSEMISPGEFLLLIDNKIIDSGSEEKIKNVIFSLVSESSVEPEDIVVFKRMEVMIGITIR